MSTVDVGVRRLSRMSRQTKDSEEMEGGVGGSHAQRRLSYNSQTSVDTCDTEDEQERRRVRWWQLHRWRSRRRFTKGCMLVFVALLLPWAAFNLADVLLPDHSPSETVSEIAKLADEYAVDFGTAAAQQVSRVFQDLVEVEARLGAADEVEKRGASRTLGW
jgi:hypothetical protein